MGFAADGLGGGTAGALLLIHDPGATALPLPAQLRMIFGLTAREADLACALVAGLRLADIAEQNGTSINTIKFHLKSVYLKTDTNTQAALIRKVAMAITGLGGDGFAPLWNAAPRGAGNTSLR